MYWGGAKCIRTTHWTARRDSTHIDSGVIGFSFVIRDPFVDHDVPHRDPFLLKLTNHEILLLHEFDLFRLEKKGIGHQVREKYIGYQGRGISLNLTSSRPAECLVEGWT